MPYNICRVLLSIKSIKSCISLVTYMISILLVAFSVLDYTHVLLKKRKHKLSEDINS